MRKKMFKIENRKSIMCCTQPEELVPPGIKPIKQVELYQKWRKFVLDDYKDILCPFPGQDVVDAVTKQKKESKKSKKGTKRRSTRAYNVRQLDMQLES